MNLSLHPEKRHIIGDFRHKLKREAERILAGSLCWAFSFFLSSPCPLAAQTNELVPAWSSGSILALPGTNAPVRTTQTDPALDALKLLDEPTDGNPDSAELPGFYRLAGLSHSDQSAEEKEELKRAFEQFTRADRFVHKGDSERAVEELLDFLGQVRFDQTRFTVLDHLGTLCVQDQDYPRAAAYMRKALKIEPADLNLISSYAAVLLNLGRPVEAIAHLKPIDPYAVRNRSIRYSVFLHRACGYSLLNQSDRAVENLRQAAQTDPASTLSSLGNSQLDNIRPDARFKDLQGNLRRHVSGKGS